jgi:APA family basic amino acid/polyamine antiporter
MKPHHSKSIGTVALFAIASGTMISSGIFILPGLAYSRIGPMVILAYALAGLVAFSASLALIELSTAMPKAGGDYFYITRSLGPGIGTVMGLLSWIALMLKTAFAVYGLSELAYVLLGVPPVVSALALTALFVLLNLAGTGEAVKLEILLVFALLAIMFAYIVSGFFRWDASNFAPEAWRPVIDSAGGEMGSEGLFPGFLGSVRRLFSNAAFVFVSFGGLLNVTTMAEEVRDPKRSIPRAMILSVTVISLAYVAMVGITAGLLSPGAFAASLTPIADGAAAVIGSPGLIIVTIASALAFITTGNAGLMSASRYPLAMSRDNLLPPEIGATGRRDIPTRAILLTGAGIAVAVLMPLEALVQLASTVILLTYLAINVAVIILRESGMRNYRPQFRIPGYPVTPVISIVLMGYFLIEMGVASLEVLLLFGGIGLLIYLLYGRKRSRYEYAALHLAKRIIDRQMQDEGLESELREIIRNREDLATDLTDELLEQAMFFDIDHRETLHGVFQYAGSNLAPFTGMPSEELSRQLEERERQYSTALNEFVAVPHMLVADGDDIRLCVIRCREGLDFDDRHRNIRALIIIIGSESRREDHLKILSGIAHIVRHPDFETMWLNAPGPRELKDELILLDRRRVDMS